MSSACSAAAEREELPHRCGGNSQSGAGVCV
jgi:hypothetical protein